MQQRHRDVLAALSQAQMNELVGQAAKEIYAFPWDRAHTTFHPALGGVVDQCAGLPTPYNFDVLVLNPSTKIGVFGAGSPPTFAGQSPGGVQYTIEMVECTTIMSGGVLLFDSQIAFKDDLSIYPDFMDITPNAAKLWKPEGGVYMGRHALGYPRLPNGQANLASTGAPDTLICDCGAILTPEGGKRVTVNQGCWTYTGKRCGA